MNNDRYIVTAYALLLMVGGIIGYMQAGSIASLIAGGLSGAIVGYTAWGIAHACRYAYYLATIASILLLGFFSYRWMLTSKFMPAGLMAIVSGAMVLWLLRSLYLNRQRTSGKL